MFLLLSLHWQGDEADCFYIVESGEVKIMIKSKVSIQQTTNRDIVAVVIFREVRYRQKMHLNITSALGKNIFKISLVVLPKNKSVEFPVITEKRDVTF